MRKSCVSAACGGQSFDLVDSATRRKSRDHAQANCDDSAIRHRIEIGQRRWRGRNQVPAPGAYETMTESPRQYETGTAPRRRCRTPSECVDEPPRVLFSFREIKEQFNGAAEVSFTAAISGFG